MENVFRYYDFSNFKKDESNSFNGNEISYSEINTTHFLIFEKNEEEFNLHIAKFSSKQDIGKISPEILELLVNNYDKSNPEHRLQIKQYLY